MCQERTLIDRRARCESSKNGLSSIAVRAVNLARRVGKGAPLRAVPTRLAAMRRDSDTHAAMSRYRRAYVEGGVFFFTVTLADRSSDVLVRHIDRLRRIYLSVQERYPFQTIAICVLPDHLHAVWSLPRDDTDFPLRWSLIKSGFSRGLPGDMPRDSSKIARRDSVVIGSTPFATMPTWSAMSTTFTSIP